MVNCTSPPWILGLNPNENALCFLFPKWKASYITNFGHRNQNHWSYGTLPCLLTIILQDHTSTRHMLLTYVHVGKMQETSCKRVADAPYPYMEQFLSNEFVASLILFTKSITCHLGDFYLFWREPLNSCARHVIVGLLFLDEIIRFVNIICITN